MIDSRAPGIRVRLEAQRKPPAPRLSSVTGFVGLAPRGPLNSPQRLDHWGHFEAIFGGLTPGLHLAPTVYQFFANGGRICYVIRAADTLDPARSPRAALWTVLNSAGQAVLDIAAATPGAWGEGLVVSLSAGNRPMPLTWLRDGATASDDIIALDSDTDLFARDPAGLGAGSTVILVDRSDSQIRVTREVVEMLGSRRVRLASPVGRDLPAGSLLTGTGLTLDVQEGDRTERFENLSLDPDHRRFIGTVVNGPPDEPSFVRREEAGHSILVRVSRSAMAGSVRPLRGVDIRATAALVAAPPLALPDDLAARLTDETTTQGRLVFTGVMSDDDRDRLLTLSTDTAYRAAIQILHARSQTVERVRDGRDAQVPVDVRFLLGHDGVAYYPDASAQAGDYHGLAGLEAIEEVSLVAVPDLSNIRGRETGSERYVFGQRQVLEHCRWMGDRFAVLDTFPEAATAPDPAAALTPDYVERLAFDTAAENGALYFPWLHMTPVEGHDTSAPVPPCGAVAGIVARTDSIEGVHRAPANERLEAVSELQTDVDDRLQGILNDAGINCLRAFAGFGLRVWGARTLSRDVAWRYVPVRRTTLLIKKELRHRLSWAVFEPNTPQLRAGIAASLNGYLSGLFRSNVLAGITPEEAYFVACNDETNPPDAFERGDLVAEIGFALLAPAEFILATVKRTAESIDVSMPASAALQPVTP